MMAGEESVKQREERRKKLGGTCAINSEAVRNLKVLELLARDSTEVNTMNCSRIGDQTLRGKEACGRRYQDKDTKK
jgi:hypothetical protein